MTPTSWPVLTYRGSHDPSALERLGNLPAISFKELAPDATRHAVYEQSLRRAALEREARGRARTLKRPAVNR